jgi:hypothetical protein
MDLATRALHLLDVEYLGCGPTFSAGDLDLVLERYRTSAEWHEGDHLVGAASNWVYVRIAFDLAATDIRLIPAGGGPDAADLRLIDEAHTIDVTRYGRVVIASGDHRFTDLAIELTGRDIEVWVAGYGFNTARRLAAAADRVIDLTDAPLALAA